MNQHDIRLTVEAEQFKSGYADKS